MHNLGVEKRSLMREKKGLFPIAHTPPKAPTPPLKHGQPPQWARGRLSVSSRGRPLLTRRSFKGGNGTAGPLGWARRIKKTLALSQARPLLGAWILQLYRLGQMPPSLRHGLWPPGCHPLSRAYCVRKLVFLVPALGPHWARPVGSPQADPLLPGAGAKVRPAGRLAKGATEKDLVGENPLFPSTQIGPTLGGAVRFSGPKPTRFGLRPAAQGQAACSQAAWRCAPHIGPKSGFATWYQVAFATAGSGEILAPPKPAHSPPS